MKLFSLLPRRLSHFACNSPGREEDVLQAGKRTAPGSGGPQRRAGQSAAPATRLRPAFLA